jgi:enolase-phosphatase E1
LFLRHTTVGDLRSLFAGHFDASIGAKTEFESYLAISSEIGVAPGAILFLSDDPSEIAAAFIAGFQVGQVTKEVLPDPRWPAIRDFAEIELVRRCRRPAVAAPPAVECGFGAPP